MTNSNDAYTTKVVRLVRHAQSAANAGLATTSPDSIPLTELGHSQAHTLAGSITSEPDLIIASPFERTINTALPTAERFPDTPFEIWAVEEFTYLSPGLWLARPQADRKPLADGYW